MLWNSYQTVFLPPDWFLKKSILEQIVTELPTGGKGQLENENRVEKSSSSLFLLDSFVTIIALQFNGALEFIVSPHCGGLCR